MADITGTWVPESRAKKPTVDGKPHRIYSGKEWVITTNGKGWQADWHLKDAKKGGEDLESSNGKSFILRGNATDDCTVRVWMITDDLMVGIATGYEPDKRYEEHADYRKVPPDIDPDDIDVFVAMRKGPVYD
jgi:hypothetical protein